jgi:hypothetical protein
VTKPETVDATPLSGAQSLVKEEAKHGVVGAHAKGDGDVEGWTSVWMQTEEGGKVPVVGMED